MNETDMHKQEAIADDGRQWPTPDRSRPKMGWEFQELAMRLDEILDILRTEHAPVKVSLKRSSTKGGQDGFDIECTSSASRNDVTVAVTTALEARRLLLQSFLPEVTE